MEPDPYLQKPVSLCKDKQFYIKLKIKFLLLLCSQGVGHHGPPVQSSKLLLTLANTVGLGFESRRDP
jgi:hypothetical protein